MSSPTRAEAREALARRFAAVHIEAPEREAALLLAGACGLRSVDLIVAPDAPLGEAAQRVEAFAARREAGEPLSRILGRRDFWTLTLEITPDVLDPRPDTETIIDAALAEFAQRRAEALRVLDFGVGSGAILLALLSEFPSATGLGVDRSEPAAKIARANAEALGFASRAEIRVGDWGEGLTGPFDLIVSNPPYIPAGDIAGLDREVRNHDPRLALDGGADGLDAYRALAPEIARLLAPGGRFALEFGEGQGAAIQPILRAAGLEPSSLRADLTGRDRVVVGGAAKR